MTEKELDRAMQVLGPKIINSIKRMSITQMIDFDAKINELVESKRDNTQEWYKPGTWIEV